MLRANEARKQESVVDLIRQNRLENKSCENYFVLIRATIYGRTIQFHTQVPKFYIANITYFKTIG